MDINLNNNIYTIRYENNKVRKPMTYKLSSKLLDTIHSIKAQKNGYIFHAVTNQNNKLSKETVRNHWNKVLKQLGVQLRIHDPRCLIGGILVSNNKTLEQVASVLEHTSISVTKTIFKSKARNCSRIIRGFFYKSSLIYYAISDIY